jgi:hypothetical protein
MHIVETTRFLLLSIFVSSEWALKRSCICYCEFD